jgi:triphosphatase
MSQTLRAEDHVEVEWQFEAGDLAAVGGWLGQPAPGSGITVTPDSTQEISDTYLDTDDWRFYRAGYVLRVRRRDEGAEATMKALVSADSSSDGLKRREITEPLDGGVRALKKSRGPVGERLRALAGNRELRSLFEVRTRRQLFELRRDGAPSGGALTGEVALDESEIVPGNGKEPACLERVEVEAGEAAGVEGFVDALREALDLHPATASKFLTGLSAAGLSPDDEAPEVGPTAIDNSQSAGKVAFAILRRHFATMLTHEPGVRLGEDPEELHDMRVATRRLRSALKLYAEFLPKRAERYGRDLRYFANALGEVRDLDVHLQRLEGEDNEDRESLERVTAALEQRRSEARRNMLEVLDSKRYERFVSDFTSTLRRGRSPSPTRSILEVAPELIRRRYKKVRKTAEGLDADSPPEDLHDLRKKGRRLRYALEPLDGVYGKPAERMIELLKELQDNLGEHQDLVVAAGLLRELGAGGDLPPRIVFSMGSLAGQYARKAAEMRFALQESKPFCALQEGKPWIKLHKAMKMRAGR